MQFQLYIFHARSIKLGFIIVIVIVIVVIFIVIGWCKTGYFKMLIVIVIIFIVWCKTGYLKCVLLLLFFGVKVGIIKCGSRKFYHLPFAV